MTEGQDPTSTELDLIVYDLFKESKQLPFMVCVTWKPGNIQQKTSKHYITNVLYEIASLKRIQYFY